MGLLLQSDFKEFKSRSHICGILQCTVCRCIVRRSQDYVTLMTVVEIVPNFCHALNFNPSGVHSDC